MSLKPLIFFVLFLITGTVSSQEISVSSEMSLRNYYAYEIVGEIDDRIIVYRDKGFTKEIDVFNKDLENTQSAEIIFEKKKVDVINVLPQDSVFQIIYGYFEKDSMVLRARVYNRSVVMTDSITFAKIPKADVRKRMTYAVSDDGSKVLMATMDIKENVLFLIYDSVRRRLLWKNKLNIIGEVRQNLSNIVISDNADFILPISEFRQDFDDDVYSMICFKPTRNDHQQINFDFSNIRRSSLLIDFDNKNKQLILAGTFTDRKAKEALGYYHFNKPMSQVGFEESLKLTYFPNNLFEELLQGKKRKSKILQDLKVQEIVLRNDGGLLIVSELEREFSRRNPYNTYSRNPYDSYSRRGWVDYYNDDIIVTNLTPTGEIDWNKVLYKKQFSQDDDGIFSSFFIMKTPSRLRFIYNDEIKKNNTVSEYLMDPIGKVARNSLLSTEYQNMKLRFKDAVQLSSNSVLVPSEKNYELNLVKITY